MEDAGPGGLRFRYTFRMSPSERDSLILLTLASGLGPVLTRRAIDALGSATGVAEASAQELAKVEGFGGKRAEQVKREIDDLRKDNALQQEKELIAAHGVTLIAFEDANYPRLLRLIYDPPPLLYVRGELRAEDALGLAIVGSRQCSGYGREQADRFAAMGAQAGLTIISGGAMGVDAAAHRAALRIGGRTIAVLGSGLAEPYPNDNRELFDHIATGRRSAQKSADAGQRTGGARTDAGQDERSPFAEPAAGSADETAQADDNTGLQPRGAVISELPMRSPPIAQNFPRRNRIVSGLSLGVLVVEASLRSGALITARVAAEEHNREVMAVPGRVDSATSAGCHKIIREGWATLVTSAADVLDALGEAGELLKVQFLADADGNPVGTGSRRDSAGRRDGPSHRDGEDGAPLFDARDPSQAGEQADAGDSSPRRDRQPSRPAADGSAFVKQLLSENQRKIIDALTEPLLMDQLVNITGLPVHVIQADLTMLQIRGTVMREGGKFKRKVK